MRHPDGTRLSPAEKRGAMIALDQLQAWAAMVVRAGQQMHPDTADIPTVPMRKLMETKGRFAGDLARAAQLSIDS